MYRVLLFLPFVLLAETAFILPDHATMLHHQLLTDIKKAQQNIYILSTQINDYQLIKTLKSRTKENVFLHLITPKTISQSNEVLKLSALNNVTIHLLIPLHHSNDIKGSLVCIDNSTLYLLSHDMNVKTFSTSYAFAFKSEQECETLFLPFITHSTIY